MASSATNAPLTDPQLAKMSAGYRTLALAIVFNVIGTVARFGPHVVPVMVVGGVASLAALILSIFAIIQVAPGMRLSPTMLVFTCVLIFIPFASFVVLLVLRIKSAESLRQAGYAVGLLGAKKP